jgi:aminoglycoside phosphotransferase (APT) family kinase protein
LVPVTTTSTVEPTSELPSTYVEEVAPEIAEQCAPLASQSSHWYENVGAGDPVQVPSAAVSVLPCTADPEIAGAAVLAAGVAGGPAITAVGGDAADADPALLVPVTTTSTVEPTSELPSTYVEEVAPEIAEQCAPLASQSSHWYENVGAGDPVQVPSAAVSVLPCTADPEIAGAAVLAAGVAGLRKTIGLGT